MSAPAPTGMKDLSCGAGYVYAHDTDEGVGGLDCLPDSLQGPSTRERGFEAELGRSLESFQALRKKAKAGGTPS